MPHAKKELALILLFMTPPYLKNSKEGRILVVFKYCQTFNLHGLAFAFSFLM